MTTPKKPRRNYSSGTVAALFTLARGGCYWPDCNEPTIRMVGTEPIQNLQTAHIRALEDHGPRADPSWTEAERNHFSNLLLLCTVHHKVIDGPRSEEFSVELLMSWKTAREAEGVDALDGLGDLTKADLGEMIREAQAEFINRVGPALDEFSKTAPELASLLKRAASDFVDRAIPDVGISEDTARLLHEAARSLDSLEDSANILGKAAHDLKGLEDNANILAGAADDLQGLESKASEIGAAARQLRALEGIVTTLANASNTLENMESQSWELKEAARELKQAGQEARQAAATLSEARDRNW